MIRRLLLSLAVLAAAPVAAAQPIAIHGETVWTGTSQGTLTNGIVVINNGRIVSVGPAGSPVPAGATEVRAKWVTPGLIAAFSRIGLSEVSGVAPTNDGGAASSAFSAALDAGDGFNPDASSVPITRLEGFTRVVVAPEARSKLFGGQGFVADTTGLPGSIFKPKAFAFVVLGEEGASRSGGSRTAAWAAIRGAFDDVRFFGARFMAHNEGNVLTRMDAQALMPAVRGDQMILFQASKASDIEAILDFKEQNPSLKIAIVGADEGWRVSGRLAEAGVPVIVDAFSNLPGSFQQLASTGENARRLSQAGVTVAIAHLDSPGHQARLATQVAGNAVANGMDFDAALAALTVTPARIFGLTGLGSLAPGNRADVIAWDGDPLEVTSAPTAVYIDGEAQPMETRQTKLRDRYLSLDESERPLAYKK
ncbi:MAG TPA: amidohydrolase family protein [Hyphomonas sp.]|nr:amidohydrolase [Hyphomonas sp.]HRJ00313.1 amidohydrolase family protein [Hyphomonas sp.]HRK67860.1 amidohydrolase family protein [Hyphomonas sp.]